MSEPNKKPNQIPESYSPVKPEIFNMVENALRDGQNQQLPPECIITPKEKVASFSGDRWPFSNVEPAVYSALGLLYGKTERRDDTGAFINDDIEYAIHNVLTGHAFGTFYCRQDDSLSMAFYGFNSYRLKMDDYTNNEIITIIKEQIYRGNTVHVNEGSGPFDYFIWGYKDNGNVLLGYKFEHGNDNLNCSYDLNNPIVLESWSDNINSITLYQPDGERLDKEDIYRHAIISGYNMLTLSEPYSDMNIKNFNGSGQLIYDEWIKRLEQANAENSEAFYFAPPVFPHFLALYENRLQLYKFMKIYMEIHKDENLQKAIDLCGQLKDRAIEGAQIGFENEWSDPKVLAMTNNERRNLLIDILTNCCVLETEMAECIKKFVDSTEGYSPKRLGILNMAEKLCVEKVIDTVVVEGVEFTIIEKAKTLYAGTYAIAPDLNSEPDFCYCMKDQEALQIIKNSVTPDCLLVLSIDYATRERPCAMLRGQETTSYEQPDGIHVIEVDPTILIKVKSTDSAWALTKKLTGEENPQWHMAPLFGLIRHIFCNEGQYGYEFNGCNENGNEEIEVYCFNGDKYVTVPVVKRYTGR